MAKRIIIGNVGGGFDARMSRPGYDAEFADVNDRKKISFAASRPTFGRVAEAGTVLAADTWIPFSTTYPGIPPVIAALRNGPWTFDNPIRRYTNSATDTVDTTAFTVVVEQGRFMMTAPARQYQTYQAGDFYNYFAVK